MKSIKELYRIGTGPSSSHTMAPRRAAEGFQHRNPECTYFRVTLYGSLAATGKGHLTDKAIFDVLRPHGNVELIWEPSIFKDFHPNGMRFEAIEDDTTYTNLLKNGGFITVGENGELLLTKQGLYIAEEMYERHTILTDCLIVPIYVLPNVCKFMRHSEH